MAQGKRTLPTDPSELPYVYRDGDRWRAVAYVTGRRPKEKRFPLSTAAATIDEWQRKTRAEISKRAAAVRGTTRAGTVGAVIATYLKTITNPHAHAEASYLLAPWLLAIGTMATSAVTVAVLTRVFNEWETAGVAASTSNHRRRELAKAWDTALPDAVNPVRKVKRRREPKPRDRAFDMHVLDAILATIPDKIDRGPRFGEWNEAKLHLRVELWTGFPAATVARILPEHHNYEQNTVRLLERQKGEGAPEVVMPLFPEGNAALHKLMKCRAWGPYDTSSAWKTFRRALKRYKRREAKAGRHVALPDDLHPYDLRHSFLSWLVDEKDADPWTVQFYGQHASMATTTRYVKRSIAKRAARLARGEKPLASLLATSEKTNASS